MRRDQSAGCRRSRNHPSARQSGGVYRSRTVVVAVPSLAVRVVVVRSWSAPPCAPASIRANDSNVRLAPARVVASRNFDEILTRQRIGGAFGVLTDPSRGVTDDALCLSDTERDVIRQALSQSPHPLAGFAHQLIDQWDHAAPDDRVAGLLLFSGITSGQERRQSRNLGCSPGLGR